MKETTRRAHESGPCAKRRFLMGTIIQQIEEEKILFEQEGISMPNVLVLGICAYDTLRKELGMDLEREELTYFKGLHIANPTIVGDPWLVSVTCLTSPSTKSPNAAIP